jgi:hypothetical protein
MREKVKTMPAPNSIRRIMIGGICPVTYFRIDIDNPWWLHPR